MKLNLRLGLVIVDLEGDVVEYTLAVRPSARREIRFRRWS